MKRKSIFAICVALIMVLLCACNANTSKSFTFNVSTGDKVKVELNTTDGYDLKVEDSVFHACKGETTVVSGTFGTEEDWEYYCDALETDENADVIETTSSKLLWKYNGEAGTEYDMILKVSDKTVVFVGGLIDDETPESLVKDVVSRLTITLEK